ncbi:hypothetical protein AHAS_Ahas06G0160800 [Arachis hypogaea]
MSENAFMIKILQILANHLLLFKENGGYKNVAYSHLCIKLLLGIVAAGSKGPVCDELLLFLSDQNSSTISTLWQLSSCPSCLLTVLRAADFSSLRLMVFGLTKIYL